MYWSWGEVQCFWEGEKEVGFSEQETFQTDGSHQERIGSVFSRSRESK